MMKEYSRGSARAELTGIEAPAALTFSRSIDFFPPHFHSSADDVGFAQGQHPGCRKKAGHISDPPTA
jgi:hypothetical protein